MEDSAGLGVEARAVARAVVALLGVVPVDVAAQVRALGTELVHESCIVAHSGECATLP